MDKYNKTHANVDKLCPYVLVTNYIISIYKLLQYIILSVYCRGKHYTVMKVAFL